MYKFNHYSQKAQNIAEKVGNLTEDEKNVFYAQVSFFALAIIFANQFKDGNPPNVSDYFTKITPNTGF